MPRLLSRVLAAAALSVLAVSAQAASFTQTADVDVGETEVLHQTLLNTDDVEFEFTALSDLIVDMVTVTAVGSVEADIEAILFGPPPPAMESFDFVNDGVITGNVIDGFTGTYSLNLNDFIAAGDMFVGYAVASSSLSSSVTVSMEVTTAAPVPLPGALGAMAAGLGAVVWRRRRLG
ncbi:MAG: hypothetical protein AAGF71_03735 [Pseudomonadota bacterium]